MIILPKKHTGQVANLCLLLIAALILASCGGSRPSNTDPLEGGGVRGSKPYTIDGETYHPISSAADFHEEGLASWYGPDFHGNPTASGELYDMNAMTAAHKTLPLGTTVRVTSKIDGTSAVVRINDRGPFVPERIIDVSRSAAVQLNMIAPGTIPVIIETVGSSPSISKDGDIKGRFYIQVGAFTSQENAGKFVNSLQSKGRSARMYFANRIGFWRVQLGPYNSSHAAENYANSLLHEFPDNFVEAE